ncbi:hypothetical protein RFI_19722, partial [Reticulomyxa filosa]
MNGTNYEELMFAERVYEIISNQSKIPEQRFFLVYTPHIVHCPLQIPKEYLTFDFADDENNCSQQTPYIYPGFNDGSQYKCRSTYHSMVTLLDIIIGNITQLLKTTGLWENTLIVLSSDNGGAERLIESAPNNYPLRGGKYSPFEVLCSITYLLLFFFIIIIFFFICLFLF